MSAVAKSEHEECEASVDHHDAISYQDSERSIFDGGWEPDAAQPELTDLVFEMRELNKCIKLGLARLQAQEHAADKEKDLQRQERVWREYELNSRLEGMPQGLHDLPHLTGEHLESISRYFLAILGGSTELIDLKRKNDTWSDYCRNPDVFSGLAVVLNPTPQTHKSPTRTGVEVNTIERGDSRPIEVPIVKATLLQKAKEKWLASVSGVTVALQSYSDNIKWQRVTWDFRDSSVCAASVSLYYEDNRSKKGEWLLQHTSRILLSSQNRENLSFSVSAGQPADNLHISYNVYLPSWDLPPVKTQVWQLSEFRRYKTLDFKCAAHILAMLHTPTTTELIPPNPSTFQFLRRFTAPWTLIKFRPEEARWASSSAPSRSYCRILQHHIRFFYPEESAQDPMFSMRGPRPGLRIERERGTIHTPSGKYINFIEGRASLCIITMEVNLPCTKLVILEDGRLPETDMNLSSQSFTADWTGNFIPGLKIFMFAIDKMIQKEWQRKWSSLLDEIDNCVRLQVTDLRNRQMREDLMFDSSFARSDFYFTILQHLRIFAQTIRDTGSDLQALADLGLFHLRIPLDNIESPAAAAWEQIMTRFEETSDRLLQRIYNQTEDIRSLRDGLFNATSLRDASKSTNMNRYIMVFTIMTILYLPLSFVAAIFSTPITEDGVSTRLVTNFVISSVTVGLGTYVIALLLIVYIDRKKIKGQIVNHFRKQGNDDDEAEIGDKNENGKIKRGYPKLRVNGQKNRRVQLRKLRKPGGGEPV